jgi:hypothetical protein
MERSYGSVELVSWWVPLAFVGAGIAGIAIALSLTSGRDGTRSQPSRAVPDSGRRRSRYEEDNELRWNPAAFVAALGLVALVVLIAIVVEAA